MKKMLLVLLVALSLVSCSKKEEEPVVSVQEEVKTETKEEKLPQKKEELTDTEILEKIAENFDQKKSDSSVVSMNIEVRNISFLIKKVNLKIDQQVDYEKEPLYGYIDRKVDKPSLLKMPIENEEYIITDKSVYHKKEKESAFDETNVVLSKEFLEEQDVLSLLTNQMLQNPNNVMLSKKDGYVLEYKDEQAKPLFVQIIENSMLSEVSQIKEKISEIVVDEFRAKLIVDQQMNVKNVELFIVGDLDTMELECSINGEYTKINKKITKKNP